MSSHLAAAASALPLPLPPPAVAAPSRALRALILSRGGAAAVCSSLRRGGTPACLVRRLCSHHSAAAAATALEEARRGRKQLGMTPALYDYLLANVREHPVRTPCLRVSVSSPFATNFGVTHARFWLSAPSWMVPDSPGASRGDRGYEREPDAGAWQCIHSMASMNCCPFFLFPSR